MLFAAEYDIVLPAWVPLTALVVFVLLAACVGGAVLWLMSRRPK